MEHTKVQAEHVHALTDELIDGLGVIPSVVCVVDTRDVLLAELSTRLVDAEELELSVCSGLLVRRSSEGGADQSGRRKDVAEEHGECKGAKEGG